MSHKLRNVKVLGTRSDLPNAGRSFRKKSPRGAKDGHVMYMLNAHNIRRATRDKVRENMPMQYTEIFKLSK